jgi:hypothetical protein
LNVSSRLENIHCKFEAEELAAKQNYESEKQLAWDNVKVPVMYLENMLVRYTMHIPRCSGSVKF